MSRVIHQSPYMLCTDRGEAHARKVVVDFLATLFGPGWSNMLAGGYNMNNIPDTNAKIPAARPEWIRKMEPFAKPDLRRAIIQLINTVIPYLALMTLMAGTVLWRWPVWATLLLALPAGAFLVRIFIFFHDCCHGSYLSSQKAMHIVGAVLGFLVFTPFGEWRHSHGIHHSTAGNLDRRGIGDVWTMTVDEYRVSSPLRRLGYRMFRHPLVLFGLGPLFLFVVVQRIPVRGTSPMQKRSVLLTDLSLLIVVALASATIGIKAYLLIQLPVMFIAGMCGIWLFYVQHQFDPTYWARSDDWESMDAAMQGSSFYKLPAVLQWFSGNIGLHHIHHLKPRIPNYNLQACLEAVKELRLPDPLTIRKSFTSISLNLWDETLKRLLSFRQVAQALTGKKRYGAT